MSLDAIEESYRQSQAEDDDPIVKVRRADGEIVFYIASQLTPEHDVLPGQRTA